MRRLVVLLLVVVLGAGCGSAPEEVRASAPPDDAPVTTPDRGPTLQPEDGLDSVLPVVWDRADLADDRRSVDVWFMGGIEECWGLARADATSGPGTVTISLAGGERPSDAPCPALGVTYVTRIPLDEPAPDGVRLVDGAA